MKDYESQVKKDLADLSKKDGQMKDFLDRKYLYVYDWTVVTCTYEVSVSIVTKYEHTTGW